jgi:uncharacterized damage-inducible protein DinB
MSERTLIELLYGKGAHANPLECLEGLSAELAGRRIDGFPHSIWQLVSHMNYWMDYELHRIREEAPPYPEHAAGSWLLDSAPRDEVRWKEAVSSFAGLIGRLATLAESDSQVLSRDVTPAHPQQAKQSSSVKAVLWQTMAHNSYHVGQIAMIRRCLGAWPPLGGGDTW